MGLDDKFENKGEELAGKAKEGAGKLTGDEKLEGEGKADQASSGLKQAAESAKDFASDAADSVKGFASEATDKIKDAFNNDK
ncbi:MAG: CsbD family protein [Flaviflexus sp.]|nr:CsbD family protein [Flaviflexus sp.]